MHTANCALISNTRQKSKTNAKACARECAITVVGVRRGGRLLQTSGIHCQVGKCRELKSVCERARTVSVRPRVGGCEVVCAAICVLAIWSTVREAGARGE